MVMLQVYLPALLDCMKRFWCCCILERQRDL